jgi:hypothetical protein
MRVAFATCAAMAEGWVDDHDAARLVEAEFQVWDDRSVDWSAYDRVLLRSVWDYSWRLEDFLAWCDTVGPARLRNRSEADFACRGGARRAVRALRHPPLRTD